MGVIPKKNLDGVPIILEFLGSKSHPAPCVRFLPEYGIVHNGKNNENGVQTRQGDEQLVKRIIHVWLRQHNYAQNVSN